jgi:RHS repeat-associated protein
MPASRAGNDRLTVHFPASREATDDQLRQSWSLPFVYRYDGASNAVGRLVSVGQPAYRPLGAGEVFYYNASYTYDGMGRIKQESRLMNPSGLAEQGLTQTLSNTFNALGSVTRSVWDDGQTITTSYDDRGQTQAVAFSGGGNLGANTIADYGTRNRAGLPLSRTTSLTFGRLARSWTYDSSGRVLTDVIQRPAWLSGAPFVAVQRSYSYLPNGELQGVTGKTRLEGVDTETGFKNLNETFEFDTTHRVTTAHETTTGYNLALTYNRVGSIVTANVGGLPSASANRDVTYHYDWLDKQAVDRLTDNRQSDSPVVALLAYTPMGEVSSREWPLGDEQRMDWDGDGQLRQVHTPDGTIERYAYDQNGQRIWAVKENAAEAGTRYWFGGSETSIPASGTTGRKRLIYIADGSGALARTERVDDGVATVELSFADVLQNVFLTAKGVTKPDGSGILTTGAVVTSWFHYGAFGEILAQGGESTHRRQANGKEADAASGLRYYGARYYDPLLMKWTSADPLYRFAPDFNPLEPQRANLYAFTNNNPVRYMDADGRDWMESLCGGAVGVLDGISGGLYSEYVLPRVNDEGDIESARASGDYDSTRKPVAFAVGATTLVVGGVGVIKGAATLGKVLAVGLGTETLATATVGTVAVAGVETATVTAGVTTAATGGVAAAAGGRSLATANAPSNAAPTQGGAAPVRAGQAGEQAAGITKNTTRIESASGTAKYRIPDSLNAQALGEIKNVSKLSYTNQLRDYAAYASKMVIRFELTVRKGTQLSGPLQEAVDAGEIGLSRTLLP